MRAFYSCDVTREQSAERPPSTAVVGSTDHKEHRAHNLGGAGHWERLCIVGTTGCHARGGGSKSNVSVQCTKRMGDEGGLVRPQRLGPVHNKNGRRRGVGAGATAWCSAQREWEARGGWCGRNGSVQSRTNETRGSVAAAVSVECRKRVEGEGRWQWSLGGVKKENRRRAGVPASVSVECRRRVGGKGEWQRAKRGVAASALAPCLHCGSSGSVQG